MRRVGFSEMNEPIKNCSTCAHSYLHGKSTNEDLRKCKIIGDYCDSHRSRLPSREEFCDRNFSAWVPIPEKPKEERRKFDFLFWFMVAMWTIILIFGASAASGLINYYLKNDTSGT